MSLDDRADVLHFIASVSMGVASIILVYVASSEHAVSHV